MFCLNYMYVVITIFIESFEIPGREHLVGYSSQDSAF